MTRKAYSAERITVTFDPGRCIHARECVRGLPGVFDAGKRPWVQPDNAHPDTVAQVVTRCPTGALQFRREDGGGQESPPRENVVIVAEDGPLYVRGDVELRDHAGTTLLEDTRLALCRCGESRNKPFCDNSHRGSGFRDAGALDDSPHEEGGSVAGRLVINTTVNGPLFLKGGFEIHDARGEASRNMARAALCRCGGSSTRPFCDGSHASWGWRDD